MKKIILLGVVASAMLSLQSCNKEQTCTCTETTNYLDGDKTQTTSVTVYNEAKKSDAKLLCETKADVSTTTTEKDFHDAPFSSIVETETVTQPDGSYTQSTFDEFGVLERQTIKNSNGSGTITNYEVSLFTSVPVSTVTFAVGGNSGTISVVGGSSETFITEEEDSYSWWLYSSTESTTCSLDD